MYISVARRGITRGFWRSLTDDPLAPYVELLSASIKYGLLSETMPKSLLAEM
jgi:hypothetical protein